MLLRAFIIVFIAVLLIIYIHFYLYIILFFKKHNNFRPFFAEDFRFLQLKMGFSMNPKQVVFFVLYQLFGVLCIPVSLYGVYQLYQYRYESFIIKRNKSLTILRLISLLSFEITCYISGNIFNLLEYSGLMFAYVSFTIICSFACMFAAVLPLSWFILYLNNWSIEMSNKKWKYIINGNNNDNWFIKHKKTYGSWKYIGKYIELLIFVNCGITSTSALFGLKYMLDGETWKYMVLMIVACIFGGLPVIALIVIIKKIPVFKDSYYISKEHSRTNKISILIIITTAVVPIYMGCAIFIMDLPIYVAGTDACIGSLLSGAVVGFLYVVSSTFMVINDNCRAVKVLKMHPVGSDRFSIDNNGLYFNDMLLNEEILEQFINTLIHEIALENMMSFIEFNQFMSYVNTTFNIESNYKSGILYIILIFICTFKRKNIAIFAKEVPQSEIVFADETSNMFKKYKEYNNNIDLSDDNTLLKLKVYELYSKYIANGAEYQINISHDQCKEFDKYCQDIDTLLQLNLSPQELHALFISPTKEIRGLLKHTFARFSVDTESTQNV